MCGIVGVWQLGKGGSGDPVDRKIVARMLQRITHRGPDDEGVWIGNGVAFGHRRLSILDVSVAGRQPMWDAEGRYVITYNGEVYNYLEIRAELQARGVKFHTGTDTEVVLEAYRLRGPHAVEQFRGMFAFAIYDTRERTLFCARDRLGVKPFVYYQRGSLFVFASEEKALLEHPAVPKRLDRRAAFNFLAGGYGYADLDECTFFDEVRQLPPATTLFLAPGRREERRSYWQISAGGEPFRSESEYEQKLCETLDRAVRLRLRSDVEVGAALSGGIDSSAVTCVASKAHPGPLVTFSAYFQDPGIDERKYIDAVLARTGAERNLVSPDEAELPNAMSNLVWHLDRPTAGTSVFAQWSVMRRARSRGIVVMLNGQGGDEVFAGYTKYFQPFLAGLALRGRVLRLVRELAFAERLGTLPPRTWRGAARVFMRELLPRANGRSLRWIDPVVHPDLRAAHQRFMPRKSGGFDLLNRELEEGTRVSPLPAILREDDRMSMAHGVETRSPFLDHELIELSFRAPGEWKIRDGVLKAPLRNAMRGVVPDIVLDRRDKLGFVTPLDRWLRGPLQERLRATLDQRSFLGLDLVEPAEMRSAIDRFYGHAGQDAFRIWSWLSLALFCEHHWS